MAITIKEWNKLHKQIFGTWIKRNNKTGEQMNFDQDVKTESAFLKLEDGKDADGVFVGEVHTFYSWYDDAEQRSDVVEKDYIGSNGKKASFKFRVNFAVNTTEGLKPFIYEGGVRVYNVLKKLNEDKELESQSVNIYRQGVKKNTTYVVRKTGDVSAQLKEQLAALTLHPVIPADA